ncbi:MAG TPA: nitrate reductase molybdenum cofactor assembly chaperone [Thermodesulfovibrionales bacterium]|jgi:nitrate reductase delta subunit|nr:nitrate reductase molybdenum cofactor assembly chaperone [Thermodesulfovibrionales bacterium]
MNRIETYQALAQAFSYPWNRETLLWSVEQLRGSLESCGEDPLAGLREFISRSDLARIQEEYTVAFDLSPACAPYVGYHLFGDTHKKGEYMIKLKGIYREHGYYPPDSELPDHLSVLFDFLAHMRREAMDEERRDFLSAHMLEGMNKMRSVAGSKPEMLWRDLITAACMICAADCEEVTTC